MGAGWCPPGLLGIGVGGSAEKCMVLAKESLLDTIDMPALLRRGPASALEELRIAVYDRVNALGIGAQGLGGLTTVVDVKVRAMPCHAASKPVGLIPQCAADRYLTPSPSTAPARRASRRRSRAVAGARRGPERRRGRARAARRPRPADARRGGVLARRADAAALGPHADGPGRRPQADGGPHGAGRAPARSTSGTAPSTTSARSTRCATRRSAPPAPPPRPAWTASPTRCWSAPASS